MAAVCVAQGQTTILTTAGTPFHTPSVTSATVSTDLVGATVWATFTDGTTSSGILTNDGGIAKVITTTGTNLFHFAAGGTEGQPGGWGIQNWNGLWNDPGITSFQISGASVSIVFDLTFGGLDGTAGSGPGLDLVNRGISGVLIPVTVTYSNIVNLDGQPAVGDLYETLRVDFGTPVNPGFAWVFDQDVDSAALTRSTVSAPDSGASLVLLAMGISGVAMMRGRFGRRV